MRKYKNKKLKLLLILAILSILGVGIGYSVLTEKLDVESSVAINEMKWDIGFSSSEDNGGAISSDSSISNDGKTLSILCDFGSTTKQKDCIVKATITNNSTFDVGLTSNPSIVYDDTYIHTLTFKWNNHPTYENKTVLKDNFIAKGESEEVILTIKNKFINDDNIPGEDLLIPVTITLNFEQYQQNTLPTKNDLAVLKSIWNISDAFNSDIYKEKIKTITFEKKIDIPSDATESWDIGVNPGTVMAYVIPNTTDSTYYDLYIQSNTQLYANIDMSWWFYDMKSVDLIKGLETLDTSDTINMSSMFSNVGYNSTEFTLDVSEFDTSNVTDMRGMFYANGYNSIKFTLDVSGFDTSKVTDMSWMFWCTGHNNPSFTLDVSNFNTANVTNMSSMFDSTGYSSGVFTLDVSNFNTSNVTNMSGMFYSTGYMSSNMLIDVSGFNTSNVTDMNRMFWYTGYSNPLFTLNPSGFDTSNVTDMSSMFEGTGYNSTIFNLDVSNFDTKNVINMSRMFYETGYNSTKLCISILIKNPNTTDYENMFANVATKSGTKITVNYTNKTNALVDAMISTKSANSNVIKGIQVD